MSTCRVSLVLALGLALTGRALAQAPAPSQPQSQAGQRAELPVKMVVLSDGARRFTVPVTIGGVTVETGLDTGSVGLRVLPGVLNPSTIEASDRPATTRYGSGAMYEGTVAKAKIDIAGLGGESTFQRIEAVGCTPRMPDCKAGQMPIAEYGIMGDGLPNNGFKAIMGVAAKEIDVDNPFKQVGVHRFIVELPRTKDETGRLILNPTEADLAGFTAVPAYQRVPAQRALSDDAVNGCLAATSPQKKICGAMTFDTGAPGITVASPDDFGKAWPDGTKAKMLLDGADGKPIVTADMTVGSYEEASHLAFRQFEFMPKTVIRMGIGPYFAYSVLHDLDHGGMAVRPRPPRS